MGLSKTNADGIQGSVYNSEQLDGQGPDYYLDYGNFTNLPAPQPTPTLQSVTDEGSTTTNSITAGSFIGTASNADKLDDQDGSYYLDYNNLTNVPAPVSSVIAGTVSWYAATSAPTGYLACDGASLSTSSYADLFAAIGYTFGGSGTSFNLPDLRDEFLRGASATRAVGNTEDYAVHNTVHTDIQGVRYNGAGNNAQGFTTLLGPQFNNGFTYTDVFGGGKFRMDPSSTHVADELRPRNIALLPIIKY